MIDEEIQVPEWIMIQEEIDHLHYCLKQALEDEKGLSSFDKMIDEATGHTKVKLKGVRRIMKRIDKLKLRLKKEWLIDSGSPI